MIPNPQLNAALRKLNNKVRYNKQGVPVAADGVPHHGPMAQHVESHMKAAHDAHMADLNNDPNGWPDKHAYKAAMKAGRKHGIKTWHELNPPQPEDA